MRIPNAAMLLTGLAVALLRTELVSCRKPDKPFGWSRTKDCQLGVTRSTELEAGSELYTKVAGMNSTNGFVYVLTTTTTTTTGDHHRPPPPPP
jgi:hypothetical protein